MNSDYAEKINMDELYTRKREIEANKLKIYRKILNRAHNQIKIASRQYHSKLFTFFVVPEFVIGIPKFDVAACIAFLIDKLTANGFIVKFGK